MEHTPKNLLIRAIRRNSVSGGAKTASDKALKDVRQFRAQLQIEPLTLERRLYELGVLPSPEEMLSLETGTGEPDDGSQHGHGRDAAS